MDNRVLLVCRCFATCFSDGTPEKGRAETWAKARVRGGLVPAREMDSANPMEFGGDRKTIGKLLVHRTKLCTSQR